MTPKSEISRFIQTAIPYAPHAQLLAEAIVNGTNVAYSTADRKTVATALHTNSIPIQYGFARRENPSLTYVDFLREQGKPTVQNPNGWKDSLLTSVLKTLGV